MVDLSDVARGRPAFAKLRLGTQGRRRKISKNKKREGGTEE